MIIELPIFSYNIEEFLNDFKWNMFTILNHTFKNLKTINKTLLILKIRVIERIQSPSINRVPLLKYIIFFKRKYNLFASFKILIN